MLILVLMLVLVYAVDDLTGPLEEEVDVAEVEEDREIVSACAVGSVGESRLSLAVVAD